MAISENVKLARIQRDRDVMDQVFSLVKHPIFSVVLAFAFIEYLQQVHIGGSKEPLMGSIVGGMLEAGIIAAPVLTAVANSGALEAMVKVPGEMLSGIAKVAPLALAAGG